MAKTNNKKKLPEENELPETETTQSGGESPDTAAETGDIADDAALPEDQNAQEDLSSQLAQERDKYLRLYAEYDNYRKRSQKEHQALYQTVRAETVSRILPVFDNLQRALNQECTDEAFYKGVEMTMTQLCEILEGIGVTPIKTVGETFDPAFMNAVFNVEDEKYGEKEIIEETQKGFVLGDRVIRFASVVVAN